MTTNTEIKQVNPADGNWPADFREVIKGAEDAAYNLGYAAAMSGPAQQGAGELPQPDLWIYMDAMRMQRYHFGSKPEAHPGARGYYSERVIRAAIAQRAASVPAEAVQPQPIGYVVKHDPSGGNFFAGKAGFKKMQATYGDRCKLVYAATVPQDIGRDAALEMKKAIIAVISYGHSHSEAPTAKFAKELLGAIERDDRVAKALATPPAKFAQAAPHTKGGAE